MRFLLDTNVVSEPTRPKADQAVVAWLDDIDEDEAFISVITITEIRFGIDRLAPGTRRKKFDRWLERDLSERFAGRILPIDVEVADVCGRVKARSEAAGRPMGDRDAYIAATAQAHGMTLVTRNVRDFESVVSQIFTPWI